MTGGKRLRIAALFVIVLVFAFIMDMSSNAITDNTPVSYTHLRAHET